jgi:hypothetical protein
MISLVLGLGANVAHQAQLVQRAAFNDDVLCYKLQPAASRTAAAQNALQLT